MDNNIREMLKFYTPLAATSVLMMSSHSIVSAGLARTSEASAALAAFAVAQSIAVMFEGPCFAMQRMGVALFRDRESYASVRKVVILVWSMLTVLMATVAFTPLGNLLFGRLLGVPSHLVPGALAAFRVFILFPAASALRSFYQALIVINRKTAYLTFNVSVRLLFMLLLSVLLPRFESLPGSSVGALVLSLGVGMEGFLAFVMGRRFVRKLPESDTTRPAVTPRAAGSFYMPIFLATVAWTLTRPAINATLARTASPELALATYQVAWSLSFMFTAVVFNLHQLAIIFGQEVQQRRQAMAFAMYTGLLGSLLLLIVSLTPLGPWMLTRMIGAPPELAAEAIKTITVFAAFPIIASVVEFSGGMIMIGSRTRMLTVGKMINMVAIVAVASLLTSLWPDMGGTIAAWAMLSGAVSEGIFLFTVSLPIYRHHQPVALRESV